MNLVFQQVCTLDIAKRPMLCLHRPIHETMKYEKKVGAYIRFCFCRKLWFEAENFLNIALAENTLYVKLAYVNAEAYDGSDIWLSALSSAFTSASHTKKVFSPSTILLGIGISSASSHSFL